MIVDKDRLRARALAATPGPWVKSYRTESRGTRILAILPGAQKQIGMVKTDKRDPNHESVDQANTDFIEAANPAVVLALLDEIESLKKQLDHVAEDRDALLNAGGHLL
ncbi:ead/Ea22-like family protein [Pseudomonas monteilii]|uniref:ead/Ea22-like family protein n=1 Tax=Pseudomonas monteilii TaxID=76759 RepID=UPI0036EE6241